MTILTAPALPTYTEDELAVLSPSALIETLIRDEDRAPRHLIDHCAARGEEMVEVLREKVDDDRAWQPEISRGEWWLLFHASMILGLIASESAGLLLVRLMRRLELTGDDDLQDWLAGHWPWLFANKPRSAIEAARTLSEDHKCDWYIRCQANDVVIDAALRNAPALLDREIDWLAARATDENEDWDVRISAANTLLDVPRERHRKLLSDIAQQDADRAAKEQWGGVYFSLTDIDNAFARGGDEPSWARRGDPWRFYAPGAIAARQDRWAEEDARADEAWTDPDDEYVGEIPLPYVRESEKIGRNDPCPCGSGEKYKKCCLAND